MKTYDWEDLDLVCTVTKEASRVEFIIYEVTGKSADLFGNYTVNNYSRKGSTSSGDDTTKISEAEKLINGCIKWDACSHVYFGDKDGYIHICGGRNWKSIIVALERVFAIARETLKEGHNDDMFDDYDLI